MKRKNILLAFFVVVCFVLFLLAQFYIQAKQKHAMTTSFSRLVTGVSIFYDLANRLAPGSVFAKKTAVLQTASLEEVDAFFILAPRRTISKRESRLLAEYVRNGGVLILSFHSEETWRHLLHLLKEFEIKFGIEERTSFKNGEVDSVRPEHNSWFFRSSEDYTFYSHLAFDSSGCENKDFDCFVSVTQADAGEVILLAGLPFFGNGMIDRGDNRLAAFRLLQDYSGLIIDEYHHFFTDKTLGDLLLEPGFILPILGMVAGAILFFLLGYSDFHQLGHLRQKRVTAPRYHEVNEALFLGLVERSDSLTAAVEKQAQFLRRSFPRKNEEIQESLQRLKDEQIVQNVAPDPLTTSFRLLRLHQEFIQERGGRTK